MADAVHVGRGPAPLSSNPRQNAAAPGISGARGRYAAKEQSSPLTELYELVFGDQVIVGQEVEAHLLDLYFIWDNPWFQVVDEALFRDNKSNKGRYYSPLLLYCILACGSRYSDRVQARSDPDDANTAGRPFLDTIEALHDELKRPNITTIQSLAILSIFYFVSTYTPLLKVHSNISRVPDKTLPGGCTRAWRIDWS
ncbi:hypothetical protein NW754_008064 [Fusarium falciforme]|nr:hypothetical protein NW754_008064 [Fusarium falciforme]